MTDAFIQRPGLSKTVGFSKISVVLAFLSLTVFGRAALAPVDTAQAAAKIGQSEARKAGDAAAQPDTKKSMAQMKAEYARPAAIPFPAGNLYTPAKLELGRKLFFDPRLSKTGAQSCGSCHNPVFSWGDGMAKGIGDGMNQLGRKSPTILNAAWGSIFMWDGRLANLEEQALGPIQSAAEMNMPLDVLMKRLQGVAEYTKTFDAIFPGEGLTPKTIAQAIATYERTVVSPDAPFDHWIAGDDRAISDSAKNGFMIFNTKAACNSCHAGWNFTDDSFHDIGLPSSDPGKGKFMPDTVRMQHAFKTPGLREIASRGPYMHDGSINSLQEVVEHYDRGGIARPSRSDLIKPIGLTSQEKTDLVAFLRTLGSDQQITASLPALPN